MVGLSERVEPTRYLLFLKRHKMLVAASTAKRKMISVRRVMLHFWYAIPLALLLVIVVVGAALSLDVVLSGISTAVVVSLLVMAAGVVGFIAAALGWITIRDAMGELRSDGGVAWRWRLFGFVGVLGILADGFVGVWNAYQKHIMFSVAVERIPFAGLPVLILLATFPFRWIEQYLISKRR